MVTVEGVDLEELLEGLAGVPISVKISNYLYIFQLKLYVDIWIRHGATGTLSIYIGFVKIHQIFPVVRIFHGYSLKEENLIFIFDHSAYNCLPKELILVLSLLLKH